jgi:hypothetical protein
VNGAHDFCRWSSLLLLWASRASGSLKVIVVTFKCKANNKQCYGTKFLPDSAGS